MASILHRLIVCLIALLIYDLAPAHSEILVGAAFPATGPNSWIGEPTKAGIQRAINDLNDAGGLLGEQLRVVWEDDYCDPERAVAAAHKLVSDGVQVVVGHQCSGAAIAAAPVYEENRVVLVSSFATNPMLTERGLRFVFRVVGRDEQQGEIAATYLAEHFAGRKIAILHDTRSYGQGLAELMRQSLHERDIKEVIFEELKPGAAAYPDVVRRMQELGVEVIYYAGYSDVGGTLRKQSWEAGLHVPMLAGDGILSQDYWIIAGPEAAEKTFTTNAPDFRDDPEAADVVAAIQAEGREVFPQTLHAYAAVQAWAQAVRMAGTTKGPKVAEALREGTFKTVIDRIDFNEKGDLSGPSTFFVWYTWRNRTYVELNPAGWKKRGFVCRAQAGLNALDYSLGPLDGLDGKQTKRAVDAFVRDHRISYSGTIDAALAAAIEAAIKRDAPVSDPARWKDRGLVCRAQAGLNALGYSPGPLDGLDGKQTKRAVDAFVRDHRISYSGTIDAALVKAVEVALIDINLPSPPDLLSQRRVALIIGNSAYQHAGMLANPVRDARAIASKLKEIGFAEVTVENNRGVEAMRQVLREFTKLAQGADIALVFYAGHGLSVGDESWLVPVDAQLESQGMLEYEAISLNLVEKAAGEAQRLSLVILDACRNNPFTQRLSRGGNRSIGRGLSEPKDLPLNSLVAYSAKHGSLASDGQPGRNSPYAMALVEHLGTPGPEIGLLFRSTRSPPLPLTV
jgi:branched-chain amino acid transport system substrate-binding protein